MLNPPKLIKIYNTVIDAGSIAGSVRLI